MEVCCRYRFTVHVVVMLIAVGCVLLDRTAYAITSQDLGIKTSIGNVSSIASTLIFIVNTLKVIGGASVIFGVGWSIFSLIFKLINSDNSSVAESLQTHIVQAIAIIVAGILLFNAGLVVRVVAEGFGVDMKFGLDEELKDSPKKLQSYIPVMNYEL